MPNNGTIGITLRETIGISLHDMPMGFGGEWPVCALPKYALFQLSIKTLKAIPQGSGFRFFSKAGIGEPGADCLQWAVGRRCCKRG